MYTKKQIVSPPQTPPKTLIDHPFFGLVLDNDQILLRDTIWDEEHLIVFCNAAAGTGKTLVAAATAELLVQYGRYQGIVYIMSPYAESKQGYLPGTLAEKSKYYHKPFFQALVSIGVNPITAICDDTPQNQKVGCGYISCGTDSFIRGVNYDRVV